MDFAFREIAYICGTALSLGVIWTNNKRDNKETARANEANAEDIKKLSAFFKKVILDDNGEIRLVDKKTFNAHIVDDRQSNVEINKRLKGVDDKLLLIIYHLNIETEDSKVLKVKGNNE